MSIIAIKDVPVSCSYADVIKMISRGVAGGFEPLSFEEVDYKTKICYIQLSERLDAARVVTRINSPHFVKGTPLTAYIPEHVPDFPLPSRKMRIAVKKNTKLKGTPLERPYEVIVTTHQDIYQELQYKYPGLYNLSKKTGHKLFDSIAEIIGERLKAIMDKNVATRESCIKLSINYRKAHPHVEDFELVQSTLHRLQDASGAPRLALQEPELMTLNAQPYVIENVPADKVKEACTNYSFKIATALTNHIEALDTNIASSDNEESIARKKVREELKKMLPYMPMALKQVVSNHFVPEEVPHRRIRIYGEPYLPGRDAMAPFTRPYVARGSFVQRSRRIYNLVTFGVEHHNYAALRAMDATVISGAKLIIRSDIPLRYATSELQTKLSAYFGGPPPNRAAMEEGDQEANDNEEQNQED